MRRKGNITEALKYTDLALQEQLKFSGGPAGIEADGFTTFIVYERALVLVASNNYVEAEKLFKKVQSYHIISIQIQI